MTQNTPEKNKCCEACGFNVGTGDSGCEGCLCHSNPPTNSPDDVIEEIITKILEWRYSSSEEIPSGTTDFLRTTLHSYVQNIREEAQKDCVAEWGGVRASVSLCEKAYQDGKQEGRSEVLAQLEERMPKEEDWSPMPHNELRIQGWNKLRSQILSIIKELKENV